MDYVIWNGLSKEFKDDMNIEMNLYIVCQEHYRMNYDHIIKELVEIVRTNNYYDAMRIYTEKIGIYTKKFLGFVYKRYDGSEELILEYVLFVMKIEGSKIIA